MVKQNTFSVIFLGVTCLWSAKLSFIFIRYDDFDSYLKILAFSVWFKSCPSLVSTKCHFIWATFREPRHCLQNSYSSFEISLIIWDFLFCYMSGYTSCPTGKSDESKLLVKIQKLVCRILSGNYARVILQKIISHLSFGKIFWSPLGNFHLILECSSENLQE